MTMLVLFIVMLVLACVGFALAMADRVPRPDAAW